MLQKLHKFKDLFISTTTETWDIKFVIFRTIKAVLAVGTVPLKYPKVSRPLGLILRSFFLLNMSAHKNYMRLSCLQ